MGITGFQSMVGQPLTGYNSKLLTKASRGFVHCFRLLPIDTPPSKSIEPKVILLRRCVSPQRTTRYSERATTRYT